MPIKSVHITNYYHKNSGGISTAYNNLMAAAARHKRYMRLIVPGEAEKVEDLSEYARIYYVPARPSPVFDRRYRIMMPWQYIPTGSIIRRILLREMPDMIEVRDKYTLSMLGVVIRINKFKDLGRPMLVSFSSERMDDNLNSFVSAGNAAGWFARRLMGNFIIPAFDYHITNSPYTAEEFYRAVRSETNPGRKDWFVNWCWRFFRSARVPLEERIRICPSGVNAELFTPARKSPDIRRQMAQRAGIPLDAVILLYAGRISPEKNVKLLPEMMELLARDTGKDYRLLVAGGGPEAEWLRSEAERRAPEKIIQLGHLDKETLADFYANADAFIHPNPKEPFGIAPLEAMASGLPAVVPNSGGLLSYATVENTWLTEPTGENFAAAVREISSNPELRAGKIEKALAAALDNTHVKAADNLIATYDELYEDFLSRRQLFTDREAAKKFDFSPLFK